MKKLTRKEAINLFRQQWADMQKELGDCPAREDRELYKRQWCNDHNYFNCNNCFLCEWANQNDYIPCDECPIDWGSASCVGGKVDYRYAPISEILALPERRIKDEVN